MTFDLATVRARLPGTRVEWFETTPSTMIEAARLAAEGCTAGTIVGADEQTAGVGRMGRRWHSEKGSGLYVSIVLRPDDRLPILMLALGLAARDAIEQTCGLEADLRWPNDLLLNGRKCAGILAQQDGLVVIAGIGINVSQQSFPGDLDTPATSLALEGAQVNCEDLVVALARAIGSISRLSTPDITKKFIAASSYARGRRVRAGDVEGTTQGLDPSGFLIVREDSGKETTILAGGVRPV